LGDEPTQLHKLADVTEAHLGQAEAEKYQATMDLKQSQEEMVEERWVSQKEKNDLQTKFGEAKAQIQ
jgi:hypothetical protein